MIDALKVSSFGQCVCSPGTYKHTSNQEEDQQHLSVVFISKVKCCCCLQDRTANGPEEASVAVFGALFRR